MRIICVDIGLVYKPDKGNPVHLRYNAREE
jgi:hypothetical protein